jgi:hypothetical protein
MLRARMLKVFAPLAVTLLLALTVLPLAIPPFRSYTIQELGEVLLWQAIGIVGWPLALFGALLSLPFRSATLEIAPIVLTLIYPIAFILLVLSLASRTVRLWPIILLHLAVLISFTAVWYGVLNGYTFMPG